MKLSNFEQSIDNRILNRGLDYWKAGRVFDIHWDDYCKHVVAVLFALRNDGMPKPEQEGTEEIIETMSTEELRSLLKEVISKEPHWRERLLARSSTDTDDIFRRYENLLRERIYTLSDRNGYIGYHQAPSVSRGGDELLSEVETLLIDEEFEQALAISKAVLLAMNEAITQADDSNGYISGTLHSAMEALKSLACAEEVPIDIHDALFAFLTDEDILEQFTDFGWHYELMDIAVQMADSEAREKRLFAIARKMAGIDEGHFSYAYSWYLRLRLSYLEQFATASEAQSFIDQNSSIPDFRRMKLEMLYRAGDHDGVIHLARLGVERDHDLPGLIRDWLEWSLKGAKGKDDRELQKEILAKLYGRFHELRYYRELKSLYTPGGWQAVRQEILQSFTGSWRDRANVFIEENMRDELWQHISQNITLDLLATYDTYLLPFYIEEIRDYYTQLIPESLNQITGRKHYQGIADLLSNRADLLGEAFCDNLIQQLLQQYPNRPAMRDEFRRAGLTEG